MALLAVFTSTTRSVTPFGHFNNALRISSLDSPQPSPPHGASNTITRVPLATNSGISSKSSSVTVRAARVSWEIGPSGPNGCHITSPTHPSAARTAATSGATSLYLWHNPLQPRPQWAPADVSMRSSWPAWSNAFCTPAIWNGRASDPKTRKGRAPVPVIRQLADRLELHRLRSGNPQCGPIFGNAKGNALALTSVVNRVILPTLNVCEQCGTAEARHKGKGHSYKRDERVPEWHGWHAARRGLGSNLYRLGVPDMVIQRILRYANVSTTATYYIKTAAADVRSAMTKLENQIDKAAQTQPDAGR